MRRGTIVLGLLALPLLFFSPSSGLAAGAGGGGFGGVGGSAGSSRADPAKQAERYYSSARKHLKKAAGYERERDEEASEKKRAKLEKKARDRYEKSVKDLRRAIKKKGDMHEAHSLLGFSLRSLGRYEEALEAYDRALKLRPDYAEAIEYRGEAYLELGRLDEAAAAYMRLEPRQPELADMLLAKMRAWVARQREAPGGQDPEVVEAFGRWLDDRAARAGGGSKHADSSW